MAHVADDSVTPDGASLARSSSEHGEPLDEMSLVGLVLETAQGLSRHLGPSLEAELGVGGHGFNVLVRLARSPGERLTMSDVAAQTGLSPAGSTRSVDRLVALGLVRRERCPSDRRSSFARLTPLGHERVSLALERHRAEVSALLDGTLNAKEAEALYGALHKLRDRVHPGASSLSQAHDLPR